MSHLRQIGQRKDNIMIIASWHKDIPQGIDLEESKDGLPWSTANWIEWRYATPEEVEMFNSGIHHYILKG